MVLFVILRDFKIRIISYVCLYSVPKICIISGTNSEIIFLNTCSKLDFGGNA